MKVVKVPNKKVSEIVEAQIQEWITSGRVQPGEKLPSVRELCEIFSVGRSAVRDAITSLKGKGMLDVRHGEGAFVCSVDHPQHLPQFFNVNRRDIRHLFMVRKILEVGIAEEAARMIEQRQGTRLFMILQDLASPNIEHACQADFDFHLAIAEATQNKVLVQLMQNVSQTIEKAIMDCHRVILSNSKMTQAVHKQHKHIYEAIISKKPTLAKEAMLAHLTYVENLLSYQS